MSAESVVGTGGRSEGQADECAGQMEEIGWHLELLSLSTSEKHGDSRQVLQINSNGRARGATREGRLSVRRFGGLLLLTQWGQAFALTLRGLLAFLLIRLDSARTGVSRTLDYCRRPLPFRLFG